MEIKTKFSVGQEVWITVHSRDVIRNFELIVRKAIIEKIFPTISKDTVKIVYGISTDHNDDIKSISISEHRIYPTKEDAQAKCDQYNTKGPGSCPCPPDPC